MTADVQPRPPLLLQDGSGLVRPQDGSAVTDWPSIRRWVLNRDGHTCQICMASPANDVDHIWPRRLGGRDHVDNLRAACGPCNKAKGSQVQYALATRSELHAAVDALASRVEVALGEFLPVVGWIATVHPDDLPWALLRLSEMKRTLDAACIGTRAATHRHRVYEDAPLAEIRTLPSGGPSGPDAAA